MALTKPLGGRLIDGYDITMETINPEAFGASVVQCLKVKGYCLCNPGISAQLISDALEDIAQMEAEGHFKAQPDLVKAGLLGLEGSAHIAELDASGVVAEGKTEYGQHLRSLDMTLSHTGLLVLPYMEALEVNVQVRTNGVVHRTGAPELAALSERQAARWLSTFASHKLMLIWALGPDPAQMELTPYGREANPERVKVEPGSFIILRPDKMGHVLSCLGKCFSLTCFYWDGCVPSRRRMDDELETPSAKALEEWGDKRLKEIKEIGTDAMPVDLPRRWELKMNHSGFTGQEVNVASMVGRFPTSWDVHEFFETPKLGTDFAIEVPLLRWDHSKFEQVESMEGVEGNPQKGKFSTNCRHSMFMDGIELFDCAKFRLSISASYGMDPGQRQLLEVGYQTLLVGGITEEKMRNSRGAVMFAGSNNIEFSFAEKEERGDGGVCGAGNNIACGRFSFVHGLKGPCVSFDQENAGSLVAAQYSSTVISRLGTWEPAPWALCYSYHFMLSQLHWFQHSVLCSLSRTGRCLTFDASANGYVRCDSVVSVLLKPMLEEVKGETRLTKDTSFEVAIAGSHINQAGKRASMTAPDGAAEQACTVEAIRAADISPLDVDACEGHCAGSILHDALEVAATCRACRPEGMMGVEEAFILGIQAQKTSFGNGLDAAGLAQIMKVAHLSKTGTMDPNVHLRLLNPLMDIDICERPAMIASEACEFALPSIYMGIMGKNSSGTNVHMVLWGTQDADKRAAAAKPGYVQPQQLPFWPAGGGEPLAAKRGYYLRGTWSGMELEPMEAAGPGEFSLTVTLGENGWEQFQILVDGDPGKVLHPDGDSASKGTLVHGPDEELYFSCWAINGLQGAGESAALAGDTSESVVVAEGAQKSIAAQVLEGPERQTFVMGDEDAGKPGDQYSISLTVSGHWQLVTWTKLTSKGEPRLAKYHVGCYWTMSGQFSWKEMAEEPPGTFTADVPVSELKGEFIIAKDGHWNQVYQPHSSLKRGEAGEDFAEGPIGLMEISGRRWPLGGQVGQTVRIQFVKQPDGTTTVRREASVSEAEAVPAPLSTARPGTLDVAVLGGWTDFREPMVMQWSGSHYRLFVRATEELRFRVLVGRQLFCPQRDAVKLPDFAAQSTRTPIEAKTSWMVTNDGGPCRWEIIVNVISEQGASRIERVDCLRVPGSTRLEDAYATGFYILVS